MAVVETKARTLSAIESRVILDLEWRGQRTVTTADLTLLLGGSDGHARVVAHRLVRKGWLEPLKRGLFLVVPADRGPAGLPDTNPLAVGVHLIARPHFYSYATACSFHHLTEQAFATVYLVCQRAQRSLVVRDSRYVFVRVDDTRFFGSEKVDVLGAKVDMATLERALLDAIDQPRHAGGIGEVSRIVRNAAPRVSWPRMVAYAERWRESAIVQRLGYLLDVHGAKLDERTRKRLRRLVFQDSKIFLGDRKRWGTSGRLVAEWGIVENVPREVLVERGEGQRRAMRLPERGRR